MKAVAVDLSPRPYYVTAALLFLVLLVPFTVNGIAVREAVFRQLPDAARRREGGRPRMGFSFLFFVVTVGLAIPGAIILAVETLRVRESNPQA